MNICMMITMGVVITRIELATANQSKPASKRFMIGSIQQKLIETFCIPNSLLAGQPLDSRREPWHDPKAGDVPVQE